jgi:hypothetical protein
MEICILSPIDLNASIFENNNRTLIDCDTIPINYVIVSANHAPNCNWNIHYSGRFREDIEFTIKLSCF